MLQVRVLHMPDLFELPHRYRKMLCNLVSMCGPHAQDGPDDPPTNQRNNARTQKYAPMCQMIHTKPVEFGPAHRCGKNALEPYEILTQNVRTQKYRYAT